MAPAMPESPSSADLTREREGIARQLLTLRKAKDPTKVVGKAKALRAEYDRLGGRIEAAEAVEAVIRRQAVEARLQAEHDRRHPPPSIEESRAAERWRLSEGDPGEGGPTVITRGGRFRIERGCVICGYRMVKQGVEPVGYAALAGASGRLCKRCSVALNARELGPLAIDALALATTDRLRRERPDVLPQGIQLDEYVVKWRTYTWAHRLQQVPPDRVAQQEPGSAPFFFVGRSKLPPAPTQAGGQEAMTATSAAVEPPPTEGQR